jgi:hypothetical protein
MDLRAAGRRQAEVGHEPTFDVRAKIVNDRPRVKMPSLKWQLTNLRAQDHDFV